MKRIRAFSPLALLLATVTLTACASAHVTDATIAQNRLSIEYLMRITEDMTYMGAMAEEVHKCKIEFTTAGTLIDQGKHDDAMIHMDSGLACANRISIALHSQLTTVRDNPKLNLPTYLGHDVDWGKGKYRITGIEPKPQAEGTYFIIHFESESGLQKSVEFLFH